MSKTPTLFLSTLLLCIYSACTSTGKTGHTSRQSLDWAGTYRGITPCADCEGILTTIELSGDNRFTLRTRYLGKSEEVFSRQGTFTWARNGNAIELNDRKDGPRFFRVGENRLTQLDGQGNIISGALADSYRLHKADNGITNRYWKLVEVMGQPVTYNEKVRKEPHMVLHPDGKRVSGNCGCNSFSGTYELLEPNRVRFSPLAVTKMAGLDDMQTEAQMLKALQTADSYYASADTLQLLRARMAPLARFVAVYLR